MNTQTPLSVLRSRNQESLYRRSFFRRRLTQLSRSLNSEFLHQSSSSGLVRRQMTTRNRNLVSARGLSVPSIEVDVTESDLHVAL
jgi:hypothetical protein